MNFIFQLLFTTNYLYKYMNINMNMNGVYHFKVYAELRYCNAKSLPYVK